MWRSLFLDDSELWFEFDLLFMWSQNMNYGELKKLTKLKNWKDKKPPWQTE